MLNGFAQCWIDSLWCSWHWCSLTQEYLDLLPGFRPALCQLKNKGQAVINAGRNAFSSLTSPIMPIDRVWAIKAARRAGASALTGVYLCHSFHRKLGRQEMAGCCETYRGGYSCICFYSCFLASGLLFGDTAVCIPAAEVPDSWQETKGDGTKIRHFYKMKAPVGNKD